jgi:hypothetical protein
MRIESREKLISAVKAGEIETGQVVLYNNLFLMKTVRNENYSVNNCYKDMYVSLSDGTFVWLDDYTYVGKLPCKLVTYHSAYFFKDKDVREKFPDLEEGDSQEPPEVF